MRDCLAGRQGESKGNLKEERDAHSLSHKSHSWLHPLILMSLAIFLFVIVFRTDRIILTICVS
jgi:hypothetical protein